MGAIRSISAAAPAQHRAGVIATFYVVAYLALSVPAVIAGVAVPRLGIELKFRILGRDRHRACAPHSRRTPPQRPENPAFSMHEMTDAH